MFWPEFAQGRHVPRGNVEPRFDGLTPERYLVVESRFDFHRVRQDAEPAVGFFCEFAEEFRGAVGDDVPGSVPLREKFLNLRTQDSFVGLYE